MRGVYEVYVLASMLYLLQSERLIASCKNLWLVAQRKLERERRGSVEVYVFDRVTISISTDRLPYRYLEQILAHQERRDCCSCCCVAAGCRTLVLSDLVWDLGMRSEWVVCICLRRWRAHSIEFVTGFGLWRVFDEC